MNPTEQEIARKVLIRMGAFVAVKVATLVLVNRLAKKHWS